MVTDDERDLRRTVGLCAFCRHVQVVRSSKRSTFYLCTLSAVDKRFVKYPHLPVTSCPGYEPADDERTQR